METIDYNYNSPAYIQLMKIIKNRITDGVYKVDSIIPSENDFVKEFKVSRVTVRSALSLLEKNGYIVRRPGLGTIVRISDPSLNKFTLVKSYSTEMKEMGQSSQTLQVELKEIKATNKLASIFNIEQGDKLYEFKRVRGSEGKPIVYSITYLCLPITLPTNNDFLYGSLYEHLIKNGVSFSKMKEVMEAEMANDVVKKVLNLSFNQAVLKRTRYSYNKDNKLTEYTINYYNSDIYKYAVEFSSK